MEDFIKKEFTWVNVFSNPPQEGIVFTLGGNNSIGAGKLVEIKGKKMWRFAYSSPEGRYVELERFPYWADIPFPNDNKNSGQHTYLKRS